jgi:type I restriction enzyme S subunit
VRGINVGDVRPLEVPFPPREEQCQVVNLLQSAFNWIDHLASETTSARKLIDHLDKAILAKAFRGELLPQDPNDEPASVLLERIRAERGATAHPSSRKRGDKLSSPSATRLRRPK